MGAFDGELYQLGYRFYESREEKPGPSPEAIARKDAVEQMHLAKMPCPGSCGEACPNHHCSAHNGEPYNWVNSFALRYRFTIYEKQEWLAGRFTVEDKINWWRKKPNSKRSK